MADLMGDPGPVTPGHLLHVGFPKAGSTALQSWFKAHPDMIFEIDALAGYRGAQALTRDVAGRQEAAWHVTSSEHLAMPMVTHDPDDLSEFTGSWPEGRRRVCELLGRIFPAATVLIVTRGFRSVLASAYSQYVREGGSQTIEQLYGRGAKPGLPLTAGDIWDYDATIALYERAFGAQNVVVLPYELLAEDASAFIGLLEDRLGLPHAGIDVPRVNVSLTAAELTWYPRFSRCASRGAALLGNRGELLTARYRARLGTTPLHRAATVLSALTPSRSAAAAATVPAAMLAACAGRAVRLAARAEYHPYRAEYLEPGG